MRTSFLLVLLLVISTAAWAQSASSTSDRTRLQQVSLQPGQSTISGCLRGHPHNYRIVEKDGTTHLLMGMSDALSSHYKHDVQLIGIKDNDRDASASADGTSFGQRFFLVHDIVSDSGPCSK